MTTPANRAVRSMLAHVRLVAPTAAAIALAAGCECSRYNDPVFRGDGSVARLIDDDARHLAGEPSLEHYAARWRERLSSHGTERCPIHEQWLESVDKLERLQR